ncbi:hypothetical protein EJB05_22915, partial [Eragrostis curvula]
MERADEERPLLHVPSQVVCSEHTSDGSVDINKQPAVKLSTGNWRACIFILGVEFSNCVAFFSIAMNLVTYLTTVLQESKVNAATNASAWAGAYFLAPLLGAFIADAYWGKYWTTVVFLPVYVAVILASTPHNGNPQRTVAYLGLYIAALGSGIVKPCTFTFGADQFDINDTAERAKKSSFCNWYYFVVRTSFLLSVTVVVWLQDNVGWGVGLAIKVRFLLKIGHSMKPSRTDNLAGFVAAIRLYRFRIMGVDPFTSLFQVMVAAVRKQHLQLPDDRSLLYELMGLSSATDASHNIKHTDQFRAPSDMLPMSSWRLCTVTQVEELKMLLRMFPIWVSFATYFAVGEQMSSTLVEQGMFMDNRIGTFAIPPASLSTVSVLSILIWVLIYETVLVPLARHVTGKDKGFSQRQRLGIGLSLSMLTMMYCALLEMKRLAIAEANGLTNQSVPVPMSIMWQVPAYFLQGAAEVFGVIGVIEYFYDYAPESMKSLCAALVQLQMASGSYISSIVLGAVAVATTRGGAPGWIPDNLNKGHMDYFFWMTAALSLLNLVQFVYFSMRHKQMN